MKRTKEWHARQKRLFQEAMKRVEERFGKKKRNTEGLKRGDRDGVGMGEW